MAVDRATPSDLLPGTLELLILKALRPGAKHGYGIVEYLRVASDDVLRIGESALYPALQLERNRGVTASLQQQQDLAAMIHLCGSGAGNDCASRGFRLGRGQRCGDHDARRHLADVNLLKRQFGRFAASG